ncbi:MAG: EAL and HDOD domain-containing protein, partial [Solirubrobacteraceae bacterium]
MSEALVARQPLFDRRLEVVGYELLFRDAGDQAAHIADADRATARVALNAFTDLGLDRVTGARPAWINVTREFILEGRALTLPAQHVVLEILEDQLIDERLVAAVRDLRDQGYRIALDDFEYSPDMKPLLELAQYVKLDVLALGVDALPREIDRLRPYGVALLAEKVETHEELAVCMAAGCELFQGYFFCRPELLRAHSIDANRLSLLQLLAALQEPDIGLRELERTVA